MTTLKMKKDDCAHPTFISRRLKRRSLPAVIVHTHRLVVSPGSGRFLIKRKYVIAGDFFAQLCAQPGQEVHRRGAGGAEILAHDVLLLLDDDAGAAALQCRDRAF